LPYKLGLMAATAAGVAVGMLLTRPNPQAIGNQEQA
jgi:hypothetical protein